MNRLKQYSRFTSIVIEKTRNVFNKVDTQKCSSKTSYPRMAYGWIFSESNLADAAYNKAKNNWRTDEEKRADFKLICFEYGSNPVYKCGHSPYLTHTHKKFSICTHGKIQDFTRNCQRNNAGFSQSKKSSFTEKYIHHLPRRPRRPKRCKTIPGNLISFRWTWAKVRCGFSR